ncbi:MAG TPA: sodium-dependent transporter [Porticoccaceae bacterium]|nr:sodium-dependent transporter [Porticoccaceae bacterium]
MTSSSTTHEHWGSRYGFLLAAIGSAAGLGNIWRFSYVAGENGGATFLVIYLLCVIFIGLPIVIAEIAVGRDAQGDAVLAFHHARPDQPWYLAGGLAVIGCFFILGFYSVIAGWSLKYFIGAASGALWQTQDYQHYFDAFISQPLAPLAWQLVMMVATVWVVAGGIQRGIEAANRVLMPTLGLIVITLAGYALTLDGASKGLSFMFAPDWSAFVRPEVYVAAIGQAFFSLGIGMAIFLTYGGYLTKGHSIPGAAATIVAGDSLLAIAAGLAIFPAVFSFGLDPASGPELAFITLPGVFAIMPGGQWLAILFFGLLVGAALTSMFSILEVPVAYFVRRTGWSRRRVCLALGAAIFVVGAPASLGYSMLEAWKVGPRNILESYDYAISNYLLPLGGIATALFTGWAWGKTRALSEADLHQSIVGRLWLFCLRFVAPLFIALAFLSSAPIE